MWYEIYNTILAIITRIVSIINAALQLDTHVSKEKGKPQNWHFEVLLAIFVFFKENKEGKKEKGDTIILIKESDRYNDHISSCGPLNNDEHESSNKGTKGSKNSTY